MGTPLLLCFGSCQTLIGKQKRWELLFSLCVLIKVFQALVILLYTDLRSPSCHDLPPFTMALLAHLPACLSL